MPGRSFYGTELRREDQTVEQRKCDPTDENQQLTKVLARAAGLHPIRAGYADYAIRILNQLGWTSLN